MSLQREASNDKGEANGAEAVALEEGHEVAEADKHHDRHADIRVIEGDGKVVPVLGLRGEGVRESSTHQGWEEAGLCLLLPLPL